MTMYLVALQAYYDGSGKPHDPGCRFTTLGGYAGTELSWPEFNRQWLDVLAEHNAPRSKRGSPYFHSKEAMHNKKGYKGWDSERTGRLVRDLLGVLSKRDRSDLIGFSCSLNIEDYKKVKAAAIPALREPEAICIDICFAGTFRHPAGDQGIEVFFDRKERFYPIFNRAWKHREQGSRTWWATLVTQVGEIDDMREKPQIQAADLLAWLANRYHTHGNEDRWGMLFCATFIVKAHGHARIDETALLELFDAQGNMRPEAKIPPTTIRPPSGTFLRGRIVQ